MKLIVHVDDFGRSRGITNNIIDCLQSENVSSVGLLATGYAYDYAAQEYKSRNNLRLSLHLDLLEGYPVANAGKVPLLLNDDGKLHNSFFNLWTKFLLSGKEKRKKLRKQVKHELEAQISKVLKTFGKDFKIELDGHQHIHMVPFVFDTLIELSKKYDISYVRIPREQFFVHVDGMKAFRNYFGINIIKHFVLNLLSSKYRKTLNLNNIKTCDYFIGVLFTGNMSVKSLEKAFSGIPQVQDPVTVEVLFHSGGAVVGEENYWAKAKRRYKFYYSPFRRAEKAAVMSPELSEVLTNFRKRFKK